MICIWISYLGEAISTLMQGILWMPTTCTVMWMWSCLPDHLRVRSGSNCNWLSASCKCSRFTVVRSSSNVVKHTCTLPRGFTKEVPCDLPPGIALSLHSLWESRYSCKGWFPCRNTNLLWHLMHPKKQPIKMVFFSHFSWKVNTGCTCYMFLLTVLPPHLRHCFVQVTWGMT